MTYKTRIQITGDNGLVLKEIEITGSDKKDNSLQLKNYNHGKVYDTSKVKVTKSSSNLLPG